MDIVRIARHLLMSHWQVHRAFPPRSLRAIKAAIHACEQTHAGQICFAVEGTLPTLALLRGQSVRERAIEMFARLRVWDTEQNNGVLIYILLADRAVEIVADRGIHTKAGAPQWTEICQALQDDFRQGRFEQGALACIESVATCLRQHFPAQGSTINELPDRPILL